MNHLLEAWITWIKYKPSFATRANSECNTLQVWRSKTTPGEETKRKKEKIYGAARCVEVEGGAGWKHTSGNIWNSYVRDTEYGAGDITENGQEKKRLKEQRQWLIHERSHVLNFLKDPRELRWRREGGLCGRSTTWVSLTLTLHATLTYTAYEKQNNCVCHAVMLDYLNSAGNKTKHGRFLPGRWWLGYFCTD